MATDEEFISILVTGSEQDQKFAFHHKVFSRSTVKGYNSGESAKLSKEKPKLVALMPS
jgi:hypothetical protein